MLHTPKHQGLVALLKAICCWILFLLLLFIAGSSLVSMFPASWERFVYGISGTAGSFIAVWAILKIEKKTFADYQLTWQSGTIYRFIKGLLIGAASFGLIILILLLFTQLKLTKSTSAWEPIMLFWYLAIIPLALMEEVAFRSYTFIKLNDTFGLGITQCIIAIAFALYHLIQGWNWQIAFLGPGIWALVFGLSAAWSKGIAMPTGIHVALNLMQTLFGMKEKMNGQVWNLQLPENATAGVTAQAQSWGMITQILVLVFAVLLTIYFLRKKNKPALQ